MADHKDFSHAEHPHKLGPGGAHLAVRHGDHVDFLYDGHLQHPHEGLTEEHVIEVSKGIQFAARPKTATEVTKPAISMVLVVVMKRCRMETTSTISLTAACTINMAITATIMARSRSYGIDNVRISRRGSAGRAEYSATSARSAWPGTPPAGTPAQASPR